MFIFGNKTKFERKKIIIVGGGEVGFHIARRLTQEDKDVTVIDLESERLKRISDAIDVQTVLGSGSSPSVLKEAGTAEASFFFAVTSSDEVNIIACLFANAIAPKEAVILARLRDEEFANYPELLGSGLRINIMVSPEKEVVRTIDRLLSMPGAVEYAEFAGGHIRMAAYRIESGPLAGEPLSRFRELVGGDSIMVAAIARKDQVIVPSGRESLLPGDTAYFIYNEHSQRRLLRTLGRNRAFFSTICIIGGGTIGLQLAKLYENKGVDLKLVDSDAERCAHLASVLDSTLVLHGDGTDKSLFIEENIKDMDVLVAATGDEETNIMACLLGKSMGVATTVARVNKPGYLSLVENIGIDHGVSPRQSAVNTLVNVVRQGRMLTSVSVGDEAAEVLEAVLAENSTLTGRPVRDLKLPRGALLVAVMRNKGVFIPNGNSELDAGDHIIMVCTREVMSEIEKRLAERE